MCVRPNLLICRSYEARQIMICPNCEFLQPWERSDHVQIVPIFHDLDISEQIEQIDP